VPEQPVPLLTPDEMGRVLDACKGTDFDARRDTAIFRLLLDSGLRVAELIGITLQDLNFDQDVALVLGKVGVSERHRLAIAQGKHFVDILEPEQNTHSRQRLTHCGWVVRRR
jgi:integrase